MLFQKESVARLIFVCCGLFSHHYALASSKCEDLLIQFVDTNPSDSAKDHMPSRKIAALIPCGDVPSVPTIIHFIERREDSVCVSQRTCGNVSAWSGYFGVTAGWSDLTLLGHFHSLRDSLRLSRDWNGFRMVATFAVAGGQIERDCSQLTVPTCAIVSK
ncbi:MAG: hypothetical protein RLZZ488_1007 [Pseudomonadota bacterium]|jgi:hypothetical protein